MTPDLPPSYEKRKKEPVPYRCDTCGDRKCRRKWKTHCWTNCGAWKPDPLPLDVAEAVEQEKEDAP